MMKEFIIHCKETFGEHTTIDDNVATLDSLDKIEFLLILEEHYCLELPEDIVLTFCTLRDYYTYICAPLRLAIDQVIVNRNTGEPYRVSNYYKEGKYQLSRVLTIDAVDAAEWATH